MSIKRNQLDDMRTYISNIARELDINTEVYEDDASNSRDSAYEIFRISGDIADYLSDHKINPLYDSRTARKRFNEFTEGLEDHSSSDGNFKFDKPQLMALSSLYHSFVDYFDIDYENLEWEPENDPLMKMGSTETSNTHNMEENILKFVESISEALEQPTRSSSEDRLSP